MTDRICSNRNNEFNHLNGVLGAIFFEWKFKSSGGVKFGDYGET